MRKNRMRRAFKKIRIQMIADNNRAVQIMPTSAVRVQDR